MQTTQFFKTPRTRQAARGLLARSLPLLAAGLLAACGSTPPRDLPAPPSGDPDGRSLSRHCAGKPMSGRGGGFYLDDGPGEPPPFDLDMVGDAIPRDEPLHRFANRPYTALGQDFVPLTARAPYRERGVASWYGRRYHGKPTSSGEIYDMYGMTAAHPTLPIPSYARVTNLANGCAVIVRINDRGPFKRGRLIDLSYVAAYKLGYLDTGSATVEVEAVFAGDALPPPVNLASVAAGEAAVAMPVQPPPSVEPVAQAMPTSAPPPAIEVLPLADSAPLIEKPRPPARSAPAVSAAPRPAPAAASLAQAATPRAASASASGAFVQLGVFASRENAEKLVADARSRLSDLAERLELRDEGGRYRVHAGPWADLAEARLAARRFGDALGLQPFVVQR